MRKENLYAHGPTMWLTLKFQVVATKKKKRVLRFLRPFHKRLPSKRNVKAHSLTQRQVFITAH